MINYYRLDYEDIVYHYNDFIKYAIKKSDKFSVITELLKPIRENKCYHDEKLCCLHPFLNRQIVGIRKWSNNGTRSLRRVMNIYESNKYVEKIIIDSMDNFLLSDEYDLPEDIGFYKGNTIWIATVTHEKLVFLYFPTNEELSELKKIGIKYYFATPMDRYVLPK